MSVYVDPLSYKEVHGRAKKYGCRWSHMTADTPEELHEMAGKIGLRRTYFQALSRWPHYDLTPNKRAQAVSLGAVEVSKRALVGALRQGAKP